MALKHGKSSILRRWWTAAVVCGLLLVFNNLRGSFGHLSVDGALPYFGKTLDAPEAGPGGRVAAGTGLPSVRSNLKVDIVSIGSKNNAELQRVQQETWANHSAVRHFFSITEDDDGRPHCYYDLNGTDLVQYIRYCADLHHEHKFLKRYTYFSVRWIFRKNNPVGWYCAQRRPASGLGKVGHYYRQQQQQKQRQAAANKGTAILPDFLILMDDDTLVRMNLLLHLLKDVDPSIPMAWAGCLQIHKKNVLYRFNPIGGLGTIFSRGAIERFMMRKLHCANPSEEEKRDEFHSESCKRISANEIFEKEVFQDGMTISDLMNAYSNRDPFCFFSDWFVGHFIHYYLLSPMYIDSFFKTHLHPFQSHINYSFQPHDNRTTTTCRENCEEAAATCHYMTVGEMKYITDESNKVTEFQT